jgi:hypothetical protein
MHRAVVKLVTWLMLVISIWTSVIRLVAGGIHHLRHPLIPPLVVCLEDRHRSSMVSGSLQTAPLVGLLR